MPSTTVLLEDIKKVLAIIRKSFFLETLNPLGNPNEGHSKIYLTLKEFKPAWLAQLVESHTTVREVQCYMVSRGR